MSSYRLSRLAQRDLAAIKTAMAARDRAAAIDFLDRLITRFEQLAARPYLGRPRDDLRAGLRSSLVGSYLVLYRPTSAGVEIARVVHGRRDLVRLF